METGEIYNNIIKLAKVKGMSETDIIQKSGLIRGDLVKLKSGQVDVPRQDSLERIAVAIGCTAAELTSLSSEVQSGLDANSIGTATLILGSPAHIRNTGWQSDDGQIMLLSDELAALKDMLNGKSKRFPRGFWHGEDGQERAFACVRYCFEKLLGCATREDVINHSHKETLKRFHLLCPMSLLRMTVYGLVSGAFPKFELQPWHLQSVPHGYWRQHPNALRDALNYWLNSLKLSAKEVLKALEHGSRTGGKSAQRLKIYRSLRQAGLNEIIREHGIRYALHLVEPSIPVAPPPTREELRNKRKMVECPIASCRKSFIILATHARVKHGVSLEELRQMTIQTESDEAQQNRFGATSKPRSPQAAIFKAKGLSLPGDWWPNDAPYAEIAVDSTELKITMTPAHIQSSSTRYVVFSRNRSMRKRITIQSKAVLRLLLSDTLSISRVGSQVSIKVLNRDTAVAVEVWLKDGKGKSAKNGN